MLNVHKERIDKIDLAPAANRLISQSRNGYEIFEQLSYHYFVMRFNFVNVIHLGCGSVSHIDIIP